MKNTQSDSKAQQENQVTKAFIPESQQTLVESFTGIHIKYSGNNTQGSHKDPKKTA